MRHQLMDIDYTSGMEAEIFLQLSRFSQHLTIEMYTIIKEQL